MPESGEKNDNTIESKNSCSNDLRNGNFTEYTSDDLRLAYMQRDLEIKKEMLEMQREHAQAQMRCPRCGSISLSGNKKGFGIGKALLGATLTGVPIGILAGSIGAKKVRVTCLSCGHQFWAGKS